MKKTLITLALLASTQAHAVCTNTPESYIAASSADAVTTYAGLSVGLVETNPLGPVISVAGKGVLYWYAKDMPEHERMRIHHGGTSVFTGAAVNNALLFLGAASGVSIVAGLVTGIVAFNNDNTACGQPRVTKSETKLSANERWEQIVLEQSNKN